ncbi:MAG: copper chaperone PCu(A)C [Chromatiales bacterium]|nr:copper chaperone PCu(A)C [Chromatiales bacterium]
MKKVSMIVAAGIMLSAFSASVLAGSAADSAMVSDPFVRAVPPGQKNSASFMKIMNHSGKDQAVVGAESPVAEVVELHTHTMVDGMMRMRQVEKIDLPAGETVVLQPGGLHVMLIGLKQDLMPGKDVDVTLKFDDGSTKQITAPIKKIQMKMMKGGMDHMKHKDMKH